MNNLPAGFIHFSRAWNFITKPALLIKTLLTHIITLFFILIFQVSHAQSLSFTYQSVNGNFCGPATIRFNASFSQPPITFYWQFGLDNEESELPNPTFTYSSPGNYKVTLIALFDNKILETSQVISIYGPPTFNVTADRNYLCKPGEVKFSMTTSVPVNIVTWNAGDGSAPVSGPSFTHAHKYADFGNYSLTVTGTDTRGCIGSGSVSVSVKKPTAQLIDTPATGCLPATVNLAAIVDLPPGSSVSSYVWDPGDGSGKQTTTTNRITHTYTSVNSYTPTLSITTSEGCTNDFTFSQLVFGDTLQSGKISTLKDTICASEIPVFTVSGISNNAGYVWDVNGDVQNTDVPALSYKFNQLGTFKVKVSPMFSGCVGKSDSMLITIQGVIADFRFLNRCDDKSFFNFRTTSLGNVSRFVWDFGDGGPLSGLPRPSRQFPPVGSFLVRLEVYDNVTGCADTTQQTIYTARPKLLGTDTFYCKGQTTTMTVIENYANPRVVQNWFQVGRFNIDSRDTVNTVVASTHGVFTNRLIIDNGAGYCRDTLFQTSQVRVGGPVTGIKIPSNLCISEQLQIKDSSKPFFATDPINGWFWEFGNGQISSLQNPNPVEYASTGNYRVKQVVSDIRGCTDSATVTIKIRRMPLFRAYPLQGKVCAGKPFELTALHRATLKWTPSNLVSCDTCTVTTVVPTGPTVYTATVVDSFGCSKTQDIKLDVWQDFNLPPNNIKDTSICVGEKVQFNLNITDKLIAWTPGDFLSRANISNPVSTPLATTTYTAVISDSGQCFPKTVMATIEVNPYPVVDVGPDLILPYDAPFTLAPSYSPDVVSYRWQPAGMLSCSNCPTPSGRALMSTDFVLTVATDKGCASRHVLRLTLDCSEKNLLMPNAFSPNGDGLNDVYYPLTRGMRMIKHFVVYNRFGQLIHERKNFRPNDKSFGWDGTFQGKKQPLGSYIYFVEAECDLGNNLSSKGTFIIAK